MSAPTQPQGTPLPGSPPSFRRRLVVGVLLLNLVVAWIGWFSLRQSRAHHHARAATTTQNIAKILDENITGTVAKVDIAIQAVVDEAERQLEAGPIRAAVLNRFIVREHARIAELAVFRATDAAGDAVYGPAARPASTTSLAHRDYFKLLSGSPGAGLVMSKPLVGGISGTWMVVLARRINGPDGSFAGLVYAGVTIEHLTKDFATLDTGRRGSIALVDADMTVVARHPGDQVIGTWVGQKLPSEPLERLMGAGLTGGTYLHRSGLDAVERTFSMRRLGLSQPLFVLVGLATDDYLAEWRLEAWKLASFMAVFLALTVVSALLLHAEWRRNEREVATRKLAQDMLLEQKEALEATLARTKRLEGIISICMHCKKINNKQESWEQIETYISDHSDALFSHGVCPECLCAHYPDLPRNRAHEPPG